MPPSTKNNWLAPSVRVRFEGKMDEDARLFLLKSMMSGSNGWVNVACSQSNVDVNDVVCCINTA